VDTENELNALGYRELKQKRYDRAIALFRLNVAEHPSSANVYDSLGEALLLAGQRDAAIRQYRKSLQLDPRDENARSVLDELQP
jgi:Flp pilus assembly protein TadD